MDVKEYWEQRLKSFCNLEGVGCKGLGNHFNIYFYRAKIRTLERIAKKINITFDEKKVLDIGSGIGFWIDYYLSKGAKQIFGVDITSEAITFLTDKYDDYNNVKLFEGDFSHLDLNNKFDFVNAFDVAYHVVDDKLFTEFVKNLCKHLKNKGFLFITDTFNLDYRVEITHVKYRSLNTYRKILEGCGVKIISLVPMCSILDWPYTGKHGIDQILTKLFLRSTQLYKRFRPCVKIAYYIDSLLTQFNIFGISLKLLVGQKSE